MARHYPAAAAEAPELAAPAGTAMGVIVGTPAGAARDDGAACGVHDLLPGAYPATRHTAYPAYPAYYARPYFYPPIGLSLNFGYSSGALPPAIAPARR